MDISGFPIQASVLIHAPKTVGFTCSRPSNIPRHLLNVSVAYYNMSGKCLFLLTRFIGNIICEVTKQPYFSNIGEAMAIGLLGSVFLTGIFFVLGSIFADASFGSIAPPITFWLISIFLWCLVSGPFGRVAVKDCQLSSFDTFRVAAIGGAVFTLVTMMIIVPAFIGLIFVCTYIKRCLQAKPFVRGDASGYKWLTSQFSWCGCGRPMCNDENV